MPGLLLLPNSSLILQDSYFQQSAWHQHMDDWQPSETYHDQMKLLCSLLKHHPYNNFPQPSKWLQQPTDCWSQKQAGKVATQ